MTSPFPHSYRDGRGSLWRRWDPHIHAPGTALADAFSASSMDDYLSAIETHSPLIEALGITDYYSTSCYERVLAEKANGRLPNVHLIFPNIELRLSIGTSSGSGVNLHLLASPEDTDHVTQLRRFLAGLTFAFSSETYSCTQDDLRRLGRDHDPDQSSDRGAYKAGVNQFKIDFNQLRDHYKNSRWAQENILIGVAAGSGDGTSGLQTRDSTFAVQRQEIERFAHVIFSSNTKVRQFWLGEGADDPDTITRKYGTLKPCIHGSDAHSLSTTPRPNGDRFTWIKGDPTFDTLRHACLEPRQRVWIGQTAPLDGSPDLSITRAITTGASWFLDEALNLNPGLVAVIGPRGSGKTALVDAIAHAAGHPASHEDSRSFLSRARRHIRGASVELTWSNGEASQAPLDEPPSTDHPEVQYLSQQFVERLCSSEGPTDELLQELHRVVFACHEASDRLGAADFGELLDAKLGGIRRERSAVAESLSRLTGRILDEQRRGALLPQHRDRKAHLSSEIERDKKSREALIGTGEAERQKYHELLQNAINDRQSRLQETNRGLQLLDDLRSEITRLRSQTFAEILRSLKETYASVGLSDGQWAALQPTFRGDPESVIAERRAAVESIRRALNDGASASPTIASSEQQLASTNLAVLLNAAEELAREIGADQTNASRIRRIDARIAEAESEVRKLTSSIANDEDWEKHRKELAAGRLDVYRETFELIEAEEDILRALYAPLETRLQNDPASRGLRLKVIRKVEFDQWAAEGEALLDRRKQGAFRGQGTLRSVALDQLLPAWQSGAAAEVTASMGEFHGRFGNDLLSHSPIDPGDEDYDDWLRRLSHWLYSTDHIRVHYTFEYENTPIDLLSPGAKGMVLLLLYLSLDDQAHRPLIVDQPEENLDPRSVYGDLVDLFRRVRNRRQVIMVTHNANLVVNSDVDQVIVADSAKDAPGRPPNLTYISGGLENPQIRNAVCEILEGGERAFLERARRLHVRFPI